MKGKKGKFVKVSKIDVTCPYCGHEHEVYAHRKTRRCWSCDHIFLIPQMEFIATEPTPHNVPFVDKKALIPEGERDICWKCNEPHGGTYSSIEAALDIIMDEVNDGDCRLAARVAILKIKKEVS